MNGEKIDTEYLKYDNLYIKAERKADMLNFEFNGKRLELDFYNMIRKLSG